jgi:hypothetical protein
VADAMTTIVDRHDQAVISTDAHALREGGAFYDSAAHWLTATSRAELDEAVRFVARSGVDEFALLADPGAVPPDELGEFTKHRSVRVAFLGPNVELSIVTYRLRT